MLCASRLPKDQVYLFFGWHDSGLTRPVLITVKQLAKPKFDIKGEVKLGEKASLGFVGELPRVTVDLASKRQSFPSCWITPLMVYFASVLLIVCSLFVPVITTPATSALIFAVWRSFARRADLS